MADLMAFAHCLRWAIQGLYCTFVLFAIIKLETDLFGLLGFNNAVNNFGRLAISSFHGGIGPQVHVWELLKGEKIDTGNSRSQKT